MAGSIEAEASRDSRVVSKKASELEECDLVPEESDDGRVVPTCGWAYTA